MKIQIGAILVISIMLMSTSIVGTVATEEKVPMIIALRASQMQHSLEDMAGR